MTYRTVWKYALNSPVTMIDLPLGAEVLDVATQDGVPHLWVLGEPGAPMMARTFVGFGTGHAVEPGARYVGTAHGVYGDLVFHIFERGGAA